MQLLETPRLILRQFTQPDLAALEAILSDPEVMQFSVSGVMTREQRQQWLNRQLRSYQTEYWMYAVADKSTQQLIGFCGLTVLEIDRQEEVEIGYRFARSQWGKGLATEAAHAVRDWAFSQLKLNRLICVIEAENGRSVRVAEKIGMLYEKKTYFHKISVQIYTIVRPGI